MSIVHIVKHLEFVGPVRVYFNRLSADPMVWCVCPDVSWEHAPWEVAVSSVITSGVATATVFRPKTAPDDEDGRPSAWLACTGRLTVYSDGHATIESL